MPNKLSNIIVGALLGMSLALPAGITEATSMAMLPLHNSDGTVQEQAGGVLSDLILEKLIDSGKFDFAESKPLATDEVKQLYGQDVATYVLINQCRATGNYNPVFESSRFDTNYAPSIDVAYVGDLIAPDLVRKIGKDSGARYIFVGTINNFGTGEGMNEGANALNIATGVFGLPFGGLFGGKSKLLGVHCTLRIIDASNGKVVWLKNAYAQDKVSNLEILGAKIGQDEISSKNMHTALAKVADKLADSVIKDGELQKVLTGA